MGAIADAIAAYAQPLLDATDGSLEQLNKAFGLAQFCFNLAITPEDTREEMLSEMRSSVEMTDEEFDDFRSALVEPMIRRHEEMFPLMHQRESPAFSHGDALPRRPLFWADSGAAAPADTRRRTDPYGPCPCNSGKKYKFCCGKRGKQTA